MNRYPVWKYAIIVIVLLVAALYAAPNLFGESPAVQISAAKTTVKVDLALQGRVEDALRLANIPPERVEFDGTSVRARFADTDTQYRARDAIQRALVPDATSPSYVVALNLLPRTPPWMAKLRANPMYLGLDLRGGVHFMLQVDMAGALTKRAESYAGDIRTALREKNVRHAGISRNGQAVEIRLRDTDAVQAAQRVITDQIPDLDTVSTPDGGEYKLTARIKPAAIRLVQEQALKQNITTLHNRINELGVAEPVIQQQGQDRIVVQLPGVQDTAKAKDILGRTANLEFRLADMSAEARASLDGRSPVPFGRERFMEGRSAPVVVHREVVASGDMLTDAQPRPDQNNQPAVSITLDSKGGRQMRELTRNNLRGYMAAILFEKGRGEVLTVAQIQGEFGNQFQITGMGTTEAAAELALLLRAGGLAAPMEIIEERTIGPTLGAENIAKGFHSVAWGFVAIVTFMVLYYMVFGMISGLALALNLVMLVAVLSMLQATLTLPGIAAMALAIGMAIDSNVLINERIREELRGGAAPQSAIHAGYERAWATILDSNISTLIAGIALLAFGSGPVRGFAVVHCIGILTSMFTAVFFSRGLVNLWYGRKKKLKSVSIGTVWRPEGAVTKSD